jgi:hypothetical protein
MCSLHDAMPRGLIKSQASKFDMFWYRTFD